MKSNRLWMVALAASVLSIPALVPVNAQPPAGGGAPPFAGRGKKVSCEEALKEAPKVNKELVPLEKATNDASAKLKKSPKDAKAKKAYVDSAYKYANTILTQPQGTMPPPIQYRACLALYRKILAVDPKHAPSLKEKKTIEDIYRTMPGGIPK